MGKNLHTRSVEFPRFERFELPKLNPEIIVGLDRARAALYEMTCADNLRMKMNSDPRSPANARYEGPGSKIHYKPNPGTGPVVDLKPEDYRIVEIPKELPEASDVETPGPDKKS